MPSDAAAGAACAGSARARLPSAGSEASGPLVEPRRAARQRAPVAPEPLERDHGAREQVLRQSGGALHAALPVHRLAARVVERPRDGLLAADQVRQPARERALELRSSSGRSSASSSIVHSVSCSIAASDRSAAVVQDVQRRAQLAVAAAGHLEHGDRSLQILV